ncbi:MAG: hypothetical protein HY731_15575 [Candidatus Tectomicrobia bacterium]|nr:hypothetical protein [Candidatus Tectomicrobia bacterium]
MRKEHCSRRVGHYLDKLGFVGTCFSTVIAMGCCSAFAGSFLSLLSTAGLGFLIRLDIQMPILYTMIALAVGGLLLSFLGHRHPYPLMLGAIGAGAVLYPFHEALDLSIFFTLIYGGLGCLFLACLWEMLLRRSGRGVGEYKAVAWLRGKWRITFSR